MIAADLRLRGRLAVAALAWSLLEVRRRHEVLRSSYPEEAGRPVQRVHPPAPFPLPVIDLTGLPAGRREPEAERLAAADAARPFRVAEGPLLRVVLLRLAPGEHLLHLAVHHVAADGWSLGVLVRELTSLYRARTEGEAPALPPLPVQDADYAAWLRGRLERGDLEGQVGHWHRRLAGAPPHL
ncbi:MAG TPA: condensation domain-containing protein, partial [Thermoanaerobaculia bacterium]|nr:condensation domain-containing protein [Thermoanaerobaculia bacterium]